MENKSRVQRQNMITMIMNVVIVILCIVFLITGFRMVEELVYACSTSFEKDSMEYNVEHGRYSQLVEMYHVSEEEGMKGGRALQEYYGVAKYFEAASLYKAFENVGDTERAERQQQKLEQAYEQMGSWNIVKDDIHEKLGME